MNLKSWVQSQTRTRSSIAHIMYILLYIYDTCKKTSYLTQERDHKQALLTPAGKPIKKTL